MKGSGQLTLFTRSSAECAYTATRTFDTLDAIFDCAWSELHPSMIALALANGKLIIVNADTTQPLLQYSAHAKEVSSVDWCVMRRHLLASASWDGTIRIWSPSTNPVGPLAVIPSTTNGVVVYEAAWSLHYPDTLLSAHRIGRHGYGISGSATRHRLSRCKVTSMRSSRPPGTDINRRWLQLHPRTRRFAYGISVSPPLPPQPCVATPGPSVGYAGPHGAPTNWHPWDTT